MFDRDLYHLFKSGVGLNSPSLSKSTAVSASARSQAARLVSMVPSLDPAIPSVNEQKKQSCISALQNTALGADDLAGHIQEGLSGFLDNMNLAVTVKKVDAYANQVPASCANINTVSGTLNGSADTLLSDVSSIIKELESGITAYLADDMLLDDFHELLDRVTAELGRSMSAIAGLIQSEISALADLREIQRVYGQAISCERLVDDNCVRPLLSKLANPDLSSIITSKYSLSDVVEGAK